jgi:hypothetical protein
MMLNRALRKTLASQQTQSILRQTGLRPVRLIAPSFSTAVQTSSSSLAPPRASSASESTPFVSTPSRKYEYFTNVELTPSGVAVIKFDNPNKKVNSEFSH